MADEVGARVEQASRPARSRSSAVQDVSELRGELSGYQNAMNRWREKTDVALRDITEKVTALAGELEGAVHAAMYPIVEKANGNMQQLADRVTALENSAESEPTPIVPTALLARLEQVERRLTEMERNSFAPPQVLSGDVDRLLEMIQANGDRIATLESAPTLDRALNSPALLAAGNGGWENVQERLANLEKAVPDFTLPDTGQAAALVLELMRRVTSIAKDRTADTGPGGKYQFRGIDEAMSAVGHAMRDVGLTLETRILREKYTEHEKTSTDNRGNTRTTLWTTCRLVARYAFVCPTDGSRHVFEAVGEGRAADDKATSKASSMALKYGLFQALMIPVADTPDGDAESPRVQDESQPWTPPAEPPAEPAAESRADKPSQTPGERAWDALTALRRLTAQPPPDAYRRLTAISVAISREGLGAQQVEGATLSAHLATAARILAAVPATPDMS